MNPIERWSLEQIARCAGIAFVDLASYRISPGILRKVGLETARRLRCVPMVFNPRRIVLVHDDPVRAFALRVDPSPFLAELGVWSEAPALDVALTTPSALDATLERRSLLRA